ncbi:MAG: hypothetical protein H0W37_07085 [Pseudonocardiales bacterium]|nr:hypothetical protein [Pseudonocardiales bacterium]
MTGPPPPVALSPLDVHGHAVTDRPHPLGVLLAVCGHRADRRRRRVRRELG